MSYGVCRIYPSISITSQREFFKRPLQCYQPEFQHQGMYRMRFYVLFDLKRKARTTQLPSTCKVQLNLPKCPICMEMLGQMRRQGSPLVDPLHKAPFLNYSFNFQEDEGLWTLQIHGSWPPLNPYQRNLSSAHFLKAVLLEGKKEGDEMSNASLMNQYILESFKLVPAADMNGIVNDDLDGRQPNPTSHLNTVSDCVNNLMMSSDTGDPGLAKLGWWWLKNCLDNHKTCKENREDGWYPVRLLDLTGEPRLLISEIDKLDGPYAALSHCSGPDQTFLQLTADNLDSFRIGIPLCLFAKDLSGRHRNNEATPAQILVD